MAAQIGRSRRFIKLYLVQWALLASGALAYLALLARPAPDAEAPAPQAKVQLPKVTSVAAPEVKVKPVKSAEGKGPSEGSAGGPAEGAGRLSEIRKDGSAPPE